MLVADINLVKVGCTLCRGLGGVQKVDVVCCELGRREEGEVREFMGAGSSS
jgi:hypothetical protein